MEGAELQRIMADGGERHIFFQICIRKQDILRYEGKKQQGLRDEAFAIQVQPAQGTNSREACAQP
jgi:hypothetical protein